MVTKAELVAQAQLAAEKLGDKLDLSTLPKGRLPIPHDTKAEIEAALRALNPEGTVDPVEVIAGAVEEAHNGGKPTEAPPHIEGSEVKKRERYRNMAWGCWLGLKLRAPSVLPEKYQRASRRYFGRFIDKISFEELKRLALHLKSLADEHAPRPAEEHISTIQRNFDAGRGTVTFPPDLEEVGREILGISEITPRYDRLNCLHPDVVRQLADAFEDASMKAMLAEIGSDADKNGSRQRKPPKDPAKDSIVDPERPRIPVATMPSDPEAAANGQSTEEEKKDDVPPASASAGGTESSLRLEIENLQADNGKLQVALQEARNQAEDRRRRAEEVGETNTKLQHQLNDAIAAEKDAKVKLTAVQERNTVLAEEVARLDRLRADLEEEKAILQKGVVNATLVEENATLRSQRGWRLGFRTTLSVALVVLLTVAVIGYGYTTGWFAGIGISPTVEPAQEEPEAPYVPKFDFSNL